MLQPAQGFCHVLSVTQRRKENFGVVMIAADFYPGEGQHADSGILDLRPNEFREIFLDLVRDSGKSGRIFCHLLNRSKVQQWPA